MEPMSADFDYDKLLENAKEQLQEPIAEHSRFQLPEMEIFVEGKTTVVRNFMQIVNAINRDPQHIVTYLLKELGAPGYIDDKRLILKARFPEKLITKRIEEYLENYVLCYECQRPDTRLVKEGRTTVITCDACGAHKPVSVRKGASKGDRMETLQEGETYEVVVKDIGKKGDGIAKMGEYTIFIPETTKGAIVKVKIERITRNNVAFGTLVTS